MGFTKIGNIWLVEGEAATVNRVGANDHEAGTSGANHGEDDAFDPYPMAIDIYQPPKNIGPADSQFERMVLNQLQDLNMSQNAHHAYRTTRFEDRMINSIMFMTSSLMSTIETIPRMSEGMAHKSCIAC